MRESSILVRPASADDLPAARAVSDAAYREVRKIYHRTAEAIAHTAAAEPRLERLGFHSVRDEHAHGLVSDRFPELHEVLMERPAGGI